MNFTRHKMIRRRETIFHNRKTFSTRKQKWSRSKRQIPANDKWTLRSNVNAVITTLIIRYMKKERKKKTVTLHIKIHFRSLGENNENSSHCRGFIRIFYNTMIQLLFRIFISGKILQSDIRWHMLLLIHIYSNCINIISVINKSYTIIHNDTSARV